MRFKDRIDLSEQSSIIYRAQCKDCSSNYPGQTLRKLATRIKEHRSAIRNCNVKASLMASHCVDTSHTFDLAETKILSHASSWTARMFKETWPSNKNSINKCIGLPLAYSVMRVTIEWRSMMTIGGEIHSMYSRYLFWRRIAALIWKLNMPLTIKSPC